MTNEIKIVKKDVTEWSVYIPVSFPEEVNNEEFIKDTLQAAMEKKMEELRLADVRKESPHHHSNRID